MIERMDEGHKAFVCKLVCACCEMHLIELTDAIRLSAATRLVHVELHVVSARRPPL